MQIKLRKAKAMNNEMPDDIELGLFYAPAPMSEHFYSVIDAETKMTPVISTKYVRADKAVPKGWKLVPIEPTGPMIMGGIHAHERNDDLPNIGTGPKSVGIYKAMISAAPQPPTKGEQ